MACSKSGYLDNAGTGCFYFFTFPIHSNYFKTSFRKLILPDLRDGLNPLSFRSNELQHGGLAHLAGSCRGNPDTNDWFATLQLCLRPKLYSSIDPTVRRPTPLDGDRWIFL
ncbi:MAG: hypothetical protein FJX89_11110 [Bacteroidetes bacterium]|nr:hypothetical protein [Bacteroidota bacterium]